MTLEHLVLLRHGETDWNASLRMQGHTDIPLNATGLAQARAAAPSLAALAPDVVVSSDLMRARETADAVAALVDLPVQTDPRLRETSLGEWEGLTRAEVMDGWPGQWERWRSSAADYTPPGGESRAQVARRAGAVVADLDAGAARRALLVVHGGLIVGLTARLLELPASHWSVLTGVSNCHWVVLHRPGPAFGAGQRWRLQAYNAGLDGVVLTPARDQVAGL